MPEDFRGFDPGSPLNKDFDAYQRNMPHWRVPGCCYFLTFRLHDSLPAEVVEAARAEAQAWQRRLARATHQHGGQLPSEELAAWQEFQQVQLRMLERLLDEGRGECLLRRPELRKALVDALHHFEDLRCEMQAYAIMPNHAHVLCRPSEGHAVEHLARSWKRHSADYIHRRLGRNGTLWQEESFDRLIRDADHYRTAVRYIAKNPLKAGLQEADAAVWLHPRIIKARAAGP